MRLSILSVFILCSIAGAQTPAPAVQPVAQAALVSPEILPDHRVVFHLRAPKANEVTVTGDFWVQTGRVEKLARDDQGVWSLATEALPPNVYSYSFTVDGVPIPDPANGQVKPGVRTQQSVFSIPGPEEEVYEPGHVPHGEVRMEYYQSAVEGKLRRMHIYFPPGYEESKTKYPVVYLFHGGGDDDSGWATIGRVNFILDNLIAQGKAKPMIVVMPNLYGIDPPVSAERSDESDALFAKSLVEEVIPFVESHYRVLPGPENRAAGGLGTGRYMLPLFLWPNLDKFSTAFFVSGGANAEAFANLEKKFPGVIENPANIKRVKFFLGDGVNDERLEYSTHLAAELKQRGYSVTLFQAPGAHGWPAFRRNFVEFVQIAFR